MQPGADQIAERAGVSRRSVFNHFADLAELYDAVVEVGMRRCESLLEKIDDNEPVARRVDQLIAVRVKFMEATSQFTRALTAQSLVGSAPDQAQRVSRNALSGSYAEVERLLQRELAHLPAEDRADLLEALAAVLNPLHWEYLRRSRQNTIVRARALVARQLKSLLRDAGVDV